MKKLFLILPLWLISITISAQKLERRKDTVFRPGEELRYRLRYGFITAAEATLSVETTDVKIDNRSLYHLVVDGRTTGAFDVFYKVRDRYDSYVDQNTLLPYLYTENIREAKYKRKDKVRFYPDQKKIVSTKGTYPAPTQTFDLVSTFYFARNLDLSSVKQGQTFKMNYFLNDEVSNLEIEYTGKERVKTAVGEFNCLKFSPSIQPGRIFKKDSKLYLWITDDNNRIPVKAQVELLVGSLTLELTRTKNLKYP